MENDLCRETLRRYAEILGLKVAKNASKESINTAIKSHKAKLAVRKSPARQAAIEINDNIRSLNMKELRAFAAARGYSVAGLKTKQHLLDAVIRKEAESRKASASGGWSPSDDVPLSMWRGILGGK